MYHFLHCGLRARPRDALPSRAGIQSGVGDSSCVVSTAAADMLAALLILPAAALQPRRVHLVVNPYGGGGAGLATLDSVLPVFEAAGIEVTTLMTEYAGHAGEMARTLPLLDGFVGIGGDGTAHEIANGMLQREAGDRVAIGIIPAGSGNTWAFDLGLEDAKDAARVVAAGDTVAVDVMAISSVGEPERVREYALNIAGYGMPAAVLTQANALRWLGSAQYELAGLLLILSGQTGYGARLTIEQADGSVTSRELGDFSFAQAQVNMHMGKKVPFAPGACMDDGLIDLVLVQRSGGADILRANALARSGAHVELPFVEVVRCKSYSLTPQRLPSGLEPSLNLDGELSGAAPFQAACVPGALDVFASRLNTQVRDSSSEVEPQLVLSLLRLLGQDRD